jgi:hypothetical protein
MPAIWFLIALNMHDLNGGPLGIGPFTEDKCRSAKIALDGSFVQTECRKAVGFRSESFNYQTGGPWARTVPVFEGDPTWVGPQN